MHWLSLIKRFQWVVDLLLIFIGAYFVAAAANALIASQLTPTVSAPVVSKPARNLRSRGSQTYEAMSARNLFGAARESLSGEVFEEGTTTTAAGCAFKESELKSCNSPFELRGVLVTDPPEWSLAVFHNKNERATAYYGTNDGENDVGGALLCAVREGEVVLQFEGGFSRCLVGEGGGAAPITRPTTTAAADTPAPPSGDDKIEAKSETEYEVERSFLDDIENNLDKVITQARFVPSFRNGKPQGFKVFSIKPGSPFQKIGLQNGDVIKSINGYELNASQAMELYSKLKTEGNIQVEVMRRGRSFTRNYNIND